MWTTEQFVESILAAIGFITLVGLSGAAWTLGCAIAARSMKWAPVNFNVTTTTRE